MKKTTWKLRAGNYYIPVQVWMRDDRVFFQWGFPPNWRILKDTLKAMGAKWHGYDDEPVKAWSLPLDQRQEFRLGHMKKDGGNPFAPYDQKLVPYTPVREYRNLDGELCPAYDHQAEMWSHVITRRHCILACEMGVGKTRVVLEAMEWAMEQGLVTQHDLIMVGPRSALESIKDDIKEWGFWFTPMLITYRGLVKQVEEWREGKPAPKFVVFDESSKVKNPTTQQSQAAKYLADCMRSEHGRDCFIVEMSGSPAPKAPPDWYWQCEVARPGFVLEGTHKKFTDRLAIISRVENDLTGGSYPKLLGWRDNTDRCTVCAELQDHLNHDPESALFGGNDAHTFEACINEVEKLYKRMSGLVMVKLKKDCLDLPDVVYRTIRLQPTQRILNAAKIISRKAKSVAQGIILLRELSDGFQYKTATVGEEVCDVCGGSGEQLVKFDPDDPWAPLTDEVLQSQKELQERLMACDACEGQGTRAIEKRVIKTVPCPKDDAVRDLLEAHIDMGRLVVFAGFTGSVDRVAKIGLGMGWNVIRVDGRGWTGMAPQGDDPFKGTRQELYQAFRRGQKDFPRILFVGQAGAAGMGLNLSASPTLVFYSNDFNFESRVQAVERNSRPGIEKTLAMMPEDHQKINIIDLVHLETDQMVLDNLNKKKRLQALTLGDVQTALECDEARIQ